MTWIALVATFGVAYAFVKVRRDRKAEGGTN
jgi:hypothetical protein